MSDKQPVFVLTGKDPLGPILANIWVLGREQRIDEARALFEKFLDVCVSLEPADDDRMASARDRVAQMQSYTPPAPIRVAAAKRLWNEDHTSFAGYCAVCAADKLAVLKHLNGKDVVLEDAEPGDYCLPCSMAALR